MIIGFVQLFRARSAEVIELPHQLPVAQLQGTGDLLPLMAF